MLRRASFRFPTWFPMGFPWIFPRAPLQSGLRVRNVHTQSVESADVAQPPTGQFHRPTRLELAVLDHSGTTCDPFVIAPTRAFVEVFEEQDCPISMDEARVPMGLRKDLHLEALIKNPVIAQRWLSRRGSWPGTVDVQRMTLRFGEVQMRCLREYSALIPGTVATADILRRQFGLKIGLTTGFMRSMSDVLLEEARNQGFVPDVSVAGDEVALPRPYPYMVYRNMMLLNIRNAASVVKVDDTVGGVQEGRNAGCWSVGVYATSTYMGINAIPHRLKKQEFIDRAKRSCEKLIEGGAHYVIPDISALPIVIKDINARLHMAHPAPPAGLVRTPIPLTDAHTADL